MIPHFGGRGNKRAWRNAGGSLDCAVQAPAVGHSLQLVRTSLMGGLGVSDATTVVCYDDWVSAYATRLWWVLNYYGHTNAKVLNGGWRRWVLEGRAITFHEIEPEPARFTAEQNEAVICHIDYLLRRYEEDDVQERPTR